MNHLKQSVYTLSISLNWPRILGLVGSRFISCHTQRARRGLKSNRAYSWSK